MAQADGYQYNNIDHVPLNSRQTSLAVDAPFEWIYRQLFPKI